MFGTLHTSLDLLALSDHESSAEQLPAQKTVKLSPPLWLLH